jgi:hypothetical protein
VAEGVLVIVLDGLLLRVGDGESDAVADGVLSGLADPEVVAVGVFGSAVRVTEKVWDGTEIAQVESIA